MLKCAPKEIMKIALLSAVLLLTGCGTSIAHLTVPLTVTSFELRAPFVFTSTGGLGGMKLEYTLTPGVYVATFEDNAGVYHRGPDGCYSSKVLAAGWVFTPASVGKENFRSDCGIYMYKNPATLPKLYIVLGTEQGMFAPKAAPAPASASVGANVISSQPQLGGATAVQGGVGVGIAMGVGAALASAERGNLMIIDPPVDREALRQALQVK
ncbi:MAG: hypothetical protein V4484_02025 [Pseudomonadota bacterium]